MDFRFYDRPDVIWEETAGLRLLPLAYDGEIKDLIQASTTILI